MAEGVVSVLLKKLCELIEEEAHLISRVKPDVILLRQKLEWFSLHLKEADDRCKEDKQIKLWVDQVRKTTFEAEDIIEEFAFQVEKNRFKRAQAFRKIGKKMQEINLRFDKISENSSNLGIGNVQDKGESSVGRRREEKEKRSPRVEEADFVGIEDEAEKISKMLIKGGPRTSVVSIVGMGGLGKTTLAKKLFNDIHIRRHFDCCAWIYVSQEFFVSDLLCGLIKCFKTRSSDELNSMNEEGLRGELSNCLKGKRYFIVIDDIWRTEAWDGIKDSFPAENKGSRIMITTRIRNVAEHADPRSEPYELPLLTDEECWELLRKKAFRKVVNHVDLEELEKVGKDIARRCNGLPLAAVVLGGLLSSKYQSIHEWRKVLKAIDWHIKEGQQEKILQILALSYNDLPYYLKMCFLSFAAFPEDSSISVTELIRIWVAEGFVQERGDETLEEVAEDHLLELIHRSLIQVAQRRFNGRVEECRIHDLLRDLAIKTAKENQFLNVYSGNVGSGSPTTARRLSITGGDICQLMQVDHLTKRTRSLFCFYQSDAPFGSKNWKSLYKCFRLLRVLHVDSVLIPGTGGAIPAGIGDLIHLRYLSVRFQGGMKTFPSTIYNLSNLQTLNVYADALQRPPLQLEHGLWKMKQLRHLYINQPFHFLADPEHVKLNELTNLQTLSRVKIGDWINKSDFDKLTSLRNLRLQGDMSLYQTALSSFIGKQENLESLMLVNGTDSPTRFISSHLHHLENLYLCGLFERLSTLQEFPPSLIKLELHNIQLLEDPMPVLEKLPKLQFLTLYDVYSGLAMKMSCSTKGFPMLESFKILYCHELEDWTIEEGAFANLRYLEICECCGLEMIPEGLQHVTTLQELVLDFEHDGFYERVQKNGLDWFKIQHVQSVKIK